MVLFNLQIVRCLFNLDAIILISSGRAVAIPTIFPSGFRRHLSAIFLGRQNCFRCEGAA